MSDSSAHADGALQLNGDHDKIASYYRDWAADYDGDMAAEGFTSPVIVAGLAAMVTEPNASPGTLDAGCGTGLVGRAFTQRRPSAVITGVDLTEDMAQKARESGAYADVLGNVDLLEYAKADGHPLYDLVLCSGTLTLGHIGIEGVDALLSLTQRGGHIAFSVRRTHSLEAGYPARIAELAAEEKVEIVSELINAPYLENGGADYWLLRRL
ncbi:MAG: class I SAM-dependent DNA methyltransferase [Cumulibacter sp.]